MRSQSSLFVHVLKFIISQLWFYTQGHTEGSVVSQLLQSVLGTVTPLLLAVSDNAASTLSPSTAHTTSLLLQLALLIGLSVRIILLISLILFLYTYIDSLLYLYYMQPASLVDILLDHNAGEYIADIVCI